MKNEDYEILPHEELERLRKEIEHLKKNPYSDSKENKNLLDSMENLTTSIKKLTSILEEAQEDLIKEYAEASPTALLKQLSMQNQKIAEGIVALSDLIKKKEDTPRRSMSGTNTSQPQMNRQMPQQAPQRMPQPPRFPPDKPGF